MLLQNGSIGKPSRALEALKRRFQKGTVIGTKQARVSAWTLLEASNCSNQTQFYFDLDFGLLQRSLNRTIIELNANGRD